MTKRFSLLQLPPLPLLSVAVLSLSAFGCQASDESDDPACEGAKCDGLGDSGDDWTPADCYESASTGAIRCGGSGLEGLAELIQSGFDPIVPMQCSDLPAALGDGSSPGEEVVKNITMPICEYLPHCFFKGSGGYCAEAWQWVDTTEPTVQCDLIDGMDGSSAAVEAYCGMTVCDSSGDCGVPCAAYASAINGKMRCAAAGMEGLAELIDSGEQPVVDMTCGEINALSPNVGAEAPQEVATICRSTPHCLFKESGGYCANAWEWYESQTPDVQCQMIDRAQITEQAKEAYCGVEVDGLCGGNACPGCKWTDGGAGPGSCTAAADN